MISEWYLEDLGHIVTGKTPPKAVENAYSITGTPFITPKDMDGRKWVSSTERNLSKDGLASVKSSIIPAGSIAVSCIGSDMGKAVMVPIDSVTNQQINSIIPDNKRCDPEFLYYLLTTMQQGLKDIAGGSATPILNKGHFGKVQVELPCMSHQIVAAKILSALDDKIQLNQQINQTLEQMAQAIFKSWFVDFEPVKAKIAALEAGGSEDDALLAAMQVISGKDPQQLTQLQTENPEQYATLRATAELFPNSLIESELGDIPEGWENFKMIDLVSQIKPGTNYQPKRQEGGIPFVNGKHVQDGFLDFSKGIKYITQEEYERVHKSWKPEVNDVLITRIGTLGRVAIVTEYDLPMAVHYNSIIIKEGVIKHPFIFFLLRSDYFQHFYHLYKKQAVQEFVTIDAVEGIKVCLPIKESVLNGLTKIFDEFLFKLRVNHCESNTLAQLRDALLPKLLSGELSVNQDVD